jgi:hypothetical protein
VVRAVEAAVHADTRVRRSLQEEEVVVVVVVVVSRP